MTARRAREPRTAADRASRPLACVLAIILVSLGSFGCNRQPEADDDGLDIVVSIAPLRGLVEPLLPEGAELVVLVPPSRSVHDWQPTPRTSRLIAEADVIVTVGLGLEPGIDRLVSRHADAGAQKVVFARLVGAAPSETRDAEPRHDHDHAEHHDEPAHEAAHEGESDQGHEHAVDPHLWLDPVLARRFVEAMRVGLGERVDAREADAVRARAEKLLARIDELHAEHERRLAPYRDRAIVTHHAAFTRLADRYGLRVAAVIRTIESAEPSPGRIREVVEAIEREGVDAIFLEPQFSDRAADRIAEAAGVRIGRLDPIGAGDWFAMMRANLDEITAKLGTPGPGHPAPEAG